jgi:hypothetical protein
LVFLITEGRNFTVRVAKTLKNAGSTRLPDLLLAVLLCAVSSTSLAGALYKWVDENGNVRYSDRLPPDQNKKKHQQLSSQGMVLSTRDAAKSPEEMAIEAESKRKIEEQQREEIRIKTEQHKQDRVLLLTFSSEEEIERARDNRMQVMDSVIGLIESSIESTQDKLDYLLNRAQQAYISKGKEIPGGLAQKIEHIERKIESRDAQLQLKQTNKEKVRRKYEVDLDRFRVLRSASN